MRYGCARTSWSAHGIAINYAPCRLWRQLTATSASEARPLLSWCRGEGFEDLDRPIVLGDLTFQPSLEAGSFGSRRPSEVRPKPLDLRLPAAGRLFGLDPGRCPAPTPAASDREGNGQIRLSSQV